MSSVFTVVPAFAVTIAAVAAIAAGVVAIRDAADGDPLRDLPVPVVVDDTPGFRSDREPVGGWPAPLVSVDGAATDVAVDRDPVDADDVLDDVLDNATDTVDDLTGDLPGDVTDSVGDLLDDVIDTVDDTVDDTLETTPDVTDAAELP